MPASLKVPVPELVHNSDVEYMVVAFTSVTDPSVAQIVVSGPALTIAWRDIVSTIELLESAQGSIPYAVSVRVTDPATTSAALGV
jgi:hypothetical protein